MSVVACFLILAAASSPPMPGPAPGATPASAEAIRYYAQGRLLVEQGALREGLGYLYRASVFDPKSASLAREVSDLAGRLGDADSALEFANRAIALEPDNPRGLWLKGLAQFRLGKADSALALFDAASSADTTEIDYARSLARTAEQLDRIDLVARGYRRVVALDENDGEAWFQLAAASARIGRFSEAEQALTSAVALTAVRPGMNFLRGWVAEELGHTHDAIDLYRSHLELHPDDRVTRRRLVNLLGRVGQYQDAYKQAREIARSDTSEDVQIVIADLAIKTGRRDEGMAVLNRLEHRAGDDPVRLAPVWFARVRNGEAAPALAGIARWSEAHPKDHRGPMIEAQARAMNDDHDGAVRSARRATELAPDSVETWVLLGTLLKDEGRYQESADVWRKTIARFPDEQGLDLELAFCLDRSGREADAESLMRAVLVRRPDDPTYLNFLGYMLADHDRKLPEAEDMVRRALDREPDNGAFVDSMGWIYYRLGRLEDARQELERAERLTGGDPIVHEHLGDVYKDLKLPDLARDQYRKSLARDGSNDRVKAKLSELR